MTEKILIVLIVVISCISCGKENEMLTKSEEISAFNRVMLNDNFTIILEEDTSYSIEIKGYQDIEDVVYTISDSTLTVDNNKRFKWTKPRKNKIEIKIKAPEFREVTANEACFITNEKPITSNHFGVVFNGKANEANLKLANNTFYYWNNFPCGGKLTLTGTTEVVKLWNYALVSVDAKNLEANYGIVENSSQGDIDLRINIRLEYGIYGIGNINLYNTPQSLINNGESNTGRLIYK